MNGKNLSGTFDPTPENVYMNAHMHCCIGPQQQQARKFGLEVRGVPI